MSAVLLRDEHRTPSSWQHMHLIVSDAGTQNKQHSDTTRELTPDVNESGLGGSLMGHTVNEAETQTACGVQASGRHASNWMRQTGKPVRPALLVQQCLCRVKGNTLKGQPAHAPLAVASLIQEVAYLLVPR